MIILVQVIGYYLAFRLRQVELKKEVHAYLKSHTNDAHLTYFEVQLQNGAFTDERFAWENENEFEFAGKMYDVIDSTTTGNRMVMHCVEDKKETELLKAFAALQNSETQHGKSRTASLLQLITTVYLPIQITCIPPAPIVIKYNFNSYISSIVERAADILTPPPQNC